MILFVVAPLQAVAAPKNPIVGSFADCCARAANGQMLAEPATTLMKSRRRITAPKAQEHADILADYIRDLRPAKWGSTVILRRGEGQPTRIVKAGDAFQIPPYTPHAGGKASDVKVRVSTTYVVEKGKPLASPA
jgi:hypothetical protein